jgi:hypothetical protein
VEPVRVGRAARFDLPRGRFVLVGADDLGELVPGIAPPVIPFIAAFTVATEALDDTRRFLDRREIPFHDRDGKLSVSGADACGTILIFEPA